MANGPRRYCEKCQSVREQTPKTLSLRPLAPKADWMECQGCQTLTRRYDNRPRSWAGK